MTEGLVSVVQSQIIFVSLQETWPEQQSSSVGFIFSCLLPSAQTGTFRAFSHSKAHQLRLICSFPPPELLDFWTGQVQICSMSVLRSLPRRGRDLVGNTVQVRAGGLSFRWHSVSGSGRRSPVHTRSPFGFPKVKQFSRVEGLTGWLRTLLRAATWWGWWWGWWCCSCVGAGCSRCGGSGGSFLLVLGWLEELEAEEPGEFGLTAGGRLRGTRATGGELTLQRDDLLQLHHVVVAQQGAGPLGFVRTAGPASSSTASRARFAPVNFVMVVIPRRVTFAVIPLPLPARHMLRLPLPLLFLPLPPLQLLVMLLRLPLMLLQWRKKIKITLGVY